MKKKKFSAILLALVLAAAVFLSACGNGGSDPAPASPGASAPSGELVERGYQSDMQKDVITIGAVRPVTGGDALFEQIAFGPQYKMWVDMINADGGLYVKSLDRKVPVEVQVYDDASDIANTTRLFEQMVSREKPDLILGPEGTAKLFACSPIAQRYGYLLLSAEGGAAALAEQFELMREDYGSVNTFSILSFSHTQVPALVKLLQAEGISSVYCAYINDLHGIEYWSAAETGLVAAGIEIKGSEPVDPNDFIPPAVINNAQASDASAFLLFAYPPQTIPITMTAAQLGYNPDLYLVGPGACYDMFGLWTFGDYTNSALEGMMAWGAWNERSSDRARAYSEMFRNYWIEKNDFWKNADGSFNPDGSVFQDWWGHIPYYSVMQILQQAVENAGELDEDGMINNATLVQYISNSTFDTVMHPQLRFTNNILEDDMYLGNIGQWQNGVFEVVDADGRRTADPIIPKPPWNVD